MESFDEEAPTPHNLSIALEEYKTIREEALNCNKNAHAILNWGFSTIIALLSAGLASFAIPSLDPVRFLFFLVLIPVYVVYVFGLWFGEVVRQQRADSFLCDLEERINTINGTERTLSWHHFWLRQRTKNPLQGLQYPLYRNIALGFLILSCLSEATAIWAFFRAYESWTSRLPFLFVPVLISSAVVLVLHTQAMHYFQYSLLEVLFRIPWLSCVIVLFRVSTFASLSLHVLGRVGISKSAIIYLVLAVLMTDIVDGYLVRCYAPQCSRLFRVLDSAVDNLGLASLVLIMLRERVMPMTPAALILVRQGIAQAVAVVFFFRGRMRRRFETESWNRLFYLWSAIVVTLYLCSIPGIEWLLNGGLAILAVTSIGNYAFPGRLDIWRRRALRGDSSGGRA